MIQLLLKFLRNLKKGESQFLFKALFFIVMVLWFSTSGYLYFELPANPDLTWKDALWWSIVSMTTVGYGDLFPTSNPGRFFIALPTMFFGISVLGYILSEVASKLVETKSRRLKGMVASKFEEHIIIINFNSLTRILSLIQELKSDSKTNHLDLILIDENLEEIPSELLEHRVQFIRGNPTHETVLERANINKAFQAIVLSKNQIDSHSDDQNLATLLMMKRLNKELHIVCECVDPKNMILLETAGCDSVVCISEFTNNLIVQELIDPGVKDIIKDLTSTTYGKQIYLTPIVNLNLNNLEEVKNWLKNKPYLLLGVRRNKKIFLNCSKDQLEIQATDEIILIGETRPEDF